MMVGRTERLLRSQARAASARERLNQWFSLGSYPQGLVLTGIAAVAWITGGTGQPVDRGAVTDPVWVAVNGKCAALITSQVEVDRIRDEYQPNLHGMDELISVSWFDSSEWVRAAEEFLGCEAALLASDGMDFFGFDVSDDLISMRLALSDPEEMEIRELALDATFALEEGIKSWRPGERDLEIQARVEAILEERGAYAPVLIVGGDERLKSYRHPLAIGSPVLNLLMGVVVARREGLHVAATRFVSAGSPDEDYVRLRRKVLRMDSEVLSASLPGSSYGSVLERLDRAYRAEGFPEGWRGHYQGGPIGFMQREFEIAPCQTESRWYRERIDLSHAVAWNPSLPGGAKAEDTYLIKEAGAEAITRSSVWPVESGEYSRLGHPAVLEI